jgi:hypothetical protein
MKKYILLIGFVFTSLFSSIKAQDIIVKKNNDQLRVKIIEIGTREIKFKLYDAPDGPIISMSKSDVKTIKIEGKSDVVLNMDDSPMSISNSAILDKTSAFKFNFFSPLSRHLAFSYEWMQKPGLNWEAGIGIIGPGVSIADLINDSKPKGAFLRGGAKFLIGNAGDIEIEGARYAHPLKGRYIKIEGILNTFSKTFNVDTSNYWGGGTTSNYLRVKNTYQSFCLNIQYGRQYIVGNTLTIGYYLGVGYGFENKTSTHILSYYDDYSIERYSHSYFGKDFPIIFTSGFTIGYIFKTPDWISRNSYAQINKSSSRKSMN